jgi:hypothetical protein
VHAVCSDGRASSERGERHFLCCSIVLLCDRPLLSLALSGGGGRRRLGPDFSSHLSDFFFVKSSTNVRPVIHRTAIPITPINMNSNSKTARKLKLSEWPPITESCAVFIQRPGPMLKITKANGGPASSTTATHCNGVRVFSGVCTNMA